MPPHPTRDAAGAGRAIPDLRPQRTRGSQQPARPRRLAGHSPRRETLSGRSVRPPARGYTRQRGACRRATHPRHCSSSIIGAPLSETWRECWVRSGLDIGASLHGGSVHGKPDSQHRPGGPRSIWAPRGEPGKWGRGSLTDRGGFPRPKLCGNFNCPKPQGSAKTRSPCSQPHQWYVFVAEPVLN